MTTGYEVTRWVRASVLGALDERLQQLRKVAKKVGAVAPTFHVVERKVVTDMELGWARPVEMVLVTVRDTQLCLDGGWRLLAVVHHDTGIVACVPGAPEGTVAKYQDVDATCDHCGYARQRTRTLVVENSSGDRRRVGGACVKDYLGHAGLSLALVERWLRESDLDAVFSVSGRQSHTAFEVAVVAQAVIDVFGYEAGGVTRDKALAMLSASTDDVVARLRKSCPVTPSVVDRATQALTWAASTADTSDFALNMKAVASHSDRPGLAGIAAYIPEGYRRAVEQAAREQAPARPTAPAPYGRHTVVGVVERVLFKHDEYTGYDVRKLVVRDDSGFTVYFTEPSNVVCEEGDRLTASVDMTPSDKDLTHAWGKRPTKAAVLAEAATNNTTTGGQQ